MSEEMRRKAFISAVKVTISNILFLVFVYFFFTVKFRAKNNIVTVCDYWSRDNSMYQEKMNECELREYNKALKYKEDFINSRLQSDDKKVISDMLYIMYKAKKEFKKRGKIDYTRVYKTKSQYDMIKDLIFARISYRKDLKKSNPEGYKCFRGAVRKLSLEQKIQDGMYVYAF